MGQSSSNTISKEDKELHKSIQADKKKDKLVKKLLFLGAGGSGKSTVFKQLRNIHGSGYSEKDRMQFNDHIHAQIIEQMRMALECIEIVAEDNQVYVGGGDEAKKQDPFAVLSSQGQNAVDVIQSAPTLKVIFAFTENPIIMTLQLNR